MVERATDGVEERHAVAPRVRQKARCRETAAQGDRRAGTQRGKEVRVQRVAVVQGHRAIEHVARREPRVGDRTRGPTLRHPHRLRRARRTGGEQQCEESVLVRRGERIEVAAGNRLGRDRERLPPRRAIDVEESLGGKVECDLVEQRPHGSVGDDQLAIRVIDVAGELGAAARRIDADDRRARKAGAQQQEDELRHVLEQHADVKGPGPTLSHQHVGAHARLHHNLAPRPSLIPVQEPVGFVLRATQYQAGQCRGSGRSRVRSGHRVLYASHARGMVSIPRTRLDATHRGSPATT